MSMSATDQHILWTRAGNRCSFRDPATDAPCPAELVDDSKSVEGPTVLGEMAHIEGEKPTSARYREDMSDAERDGYGNRILLCRPHHKIIDEQASTFTPARLHAMKTGHEDWVRVTLRPKEWNVTPPTRYLQEDVFTTLLPVERVPHRIYSAPCSVNEAELKKKVGGQFLPAFIIRSGKLLSFWNLKKQPDYLRALLKVRKVEEIQAKSWIGVPEKERLYSELLDRCLNKITGHRALTLDKVHGRYFFPALKLGESRKIKYLTVGGKFSTKSVVWNPVTKKTGIPKKYWVHLAVRLKFHRVTNSSWVLAVRPETHFTKDSVTPLEGDKVGKKSTSRKSRMWNFDVFQHVQMWRHYLGDGQPRIILKMEDQSLIVSCNLLHATVSWPGIPGDEKQVRTADIEEDLFSVAGLEAVLRDESDAGFEFQDEEEEEDDDAGEA